VKLSRFYFIFNIDPIQRQSLISLTSLIVITGIGFLSTMYFAHVLGPAVYGAYSLFLAYFFVFNLIGEGGLSQGAVKKISEGIDQNKFFTGYFVLRIFLCLLTLMILYLFSGHFIDLNNTGLLPFLFLALMINCFYNILTTGVYGLQKVGVQQTASMFTQIGRIIAQIIALILGFAAFGLVGGFIVGTLIGGIFCIPFNSLRPEKFSFFHIRNLFTFSIWIFLSSVGSTIFGYTDKILIGYFMGNADVGIYSIVFQFTIAATLPTLALQTTLYPKFSNMSATCQQHVSNRRLRKNITTPLPGLHLFPLTRHPSLHRRVAFRQTNTLFLLWLGFLLWCPSPCHHPAGADLQCLHVPPDDDLKCDQ